MDEGKSRSPIKDAGWMILFLIVIGVIWVAQGGPQKMISMNPSLTQWPASRSHQKEPSLKETKSLSEKGSEELFQAVESKDSPYKGKVHLNAYGAKETDPQEEYLEIISASENKEDKPILITGWTLEGKENFEIAIGQGAYLPYSGQLPSQQPIYLEPAGKAVIVTGQSPIGTSFRLNICTGYFNQFQKFVPYLPKECPDIRDEEIPISYPDACFNFIKGLSRCEIPFNIPLETQFAIGNDCILFLNKRANYNSCVNLYKNTKDFYKKEWRIYLGRSKEMWANQRERIILRDNEGKIVDEVSYN